jgi:hypothetical protein
MLRETKKGKNMEGLILAFIALRREFQRPEKPVAEPEFEQFDLSALTRPYRLENEGLDRRHAVQPVRATGEIRQATT